MEKVLSIFLALVYCTMATASEVCNKCDLAPVEDSRNYFSYNDNTRGYCTNNQPIDDLNECVGYCPSRPFYNSTKDEFLDGCMGCTPIGAEIREIEFDCEDGSKLYIRCPIPKQCYCEKCFYKPRNDEIYVPPPRK